MKFRVDLDMFRGPLDLLLYLVRKHELDITEISLAQLTEQYLNYLAVLEKIDFNVIGEFLDIASTLIEIKSRSVLPRAEEVEAPLEDPHNELVHLLLEYKQYKDASSILEERGRSWQQRFGRQADDAPPRRRDLSDQPIHEVELWDLVSALGRIMRTNAAAQSTSIVYDDTPIQDYMRRIHQQLVSHGQASYTEMFVLGMHKASLIGVFLAILELVRHHGVRAEQSAAHGEIMLTPTDGFDTTLSLDDTDDYGHSEAINAALNDEPS